MDRLRRNKIFRCLLIITFTINITIIIIMNVSICISDPGPPHSPQSRRAALPHAGFVGTEWEASLWCRSRPPVGPVPPRGNETSTSPSGGGGGRAGSSSMAGSPSHRFRSHALKHPHTCAHARTRARTHTHTHTQLCTQTILSSAYIIGHPCYTDFQNLFWFAAQVPPIPPPWKSFGSFCRGCFT